MESVVAWVYLIVAIILEVAGTTCLKLSNGFSKSLPVAGVVIFYALSFLCLARVLKSMPVSIAYSIWAGVGTSLIALLGAVAFNEGMSALKAICIGLIICGVAGLRVAGVE